MLDNERTIFYDVLKKVNEKRISRGNFDKVFIVSHHRNKTSQAAIAKKNA